MAPARPIGLTAEEEQPLRMWTRAGTTAQRLARRVLDPQAEPTWADLVPLLDDTSNKSRDHAVEIAGVALDEDGLDVAALEATLERQRSAGRR